MKKYLLLIIPVCISMSCKNSELEMLKNQVKKKDTQILELQEQIDHYQSTNNSLLDRLADMSVINKNDAASIKSSLQGINAQFDLISSLNNEIEEKDSINAVLVNNLKSSLIDFDDDDIQISVKGSAVYVSLSDQMLFQSGSTKINSEAFKVLGKVAMIINDNDQLNVLVEGHTDNVPISNINYKDNWDLSVIRATSVVRILQEQFYVAPERLTAAGRADYQPKNENETQTGRRQNRRTEIIITPKLDQFFELLSTEGLVG